MLSKKAFIAMCEIALFIGNGILWGYILALWLCE